MALPKIIKARIACLCALVCLLASVGLAYGRKGKIAEPRRGNRGIEIDSSKINRPSREEVARAINGPDRAKMAAEIAAYGATERPSADRVLLLDPVKAVQGISKNDEPLPSGMDPPRGRGTSLLKPRGGKLEYDKELIAIEAHRLAIEKIAELSSGFSAHMVDKISESAGFDTGHQGILWNSLSGLRKIEVVILAASDVSPQNAEHVLALMIRSLALEYPSVREDPELGVYLRQALPATAPQYRYTNFENRTLPEQSKWRRVIHAIHRYASSGGALNISIFFRIMNLVPAVEYDILRGCRSAACVLKQGLVMVEPRNRETMILDMIQHTLGVYDSARYEPAFRPYINKLLSEGQSEDKGER